MERYIGLRQGVRYNTKVGYNFVLNLVKKEDFGYRQIRTIKVSDAQQWIMKLHSDMTKILFVCHGNICRSPMAEFVMKDLVRKAGLEKQFHIASAATSTEEVGNPVYPPARRKLAEHGISCSGKTARQLKKQDYGQFDLLKGI